MDLLKHKSKTLENYPGSGVLVPRADSVVLWDLLRIRRPGLHFMTSASHTQCTSVFYSVKWKNNIYEALPKLLNNKIYARCEGPFKRAVQREHAFASVMMTLHAVKGLCFV